MCGRFILGESNWAEYHEALSILHPGKTTVSYNIKPTQSIAMAFAGDNGTEASTARWWFVPHWHKTGVKDWKATTFNARIETAHEKPVFRTAWKQGRCIIPASGYYEWTGPKGNKQPWVISVDQNIPVFFFAGLYSMLRDGQRTCSILTRAAEPEISDIHHRMPIILNSEQLPRWLTREDDDAYVIENYGLGWTGKFRTSKVRPFGITDDGPELIDEYDR